MRYNKTDNHKTLAAKTDIIDSKIIDEETIIFPQRL